MPVFGVTGHRAVKQREAGDLRRFARLIVERMRLCGATEIITGMALGWDTAVAQACRDLGMPYVAALPNPRQADPWPIEDQREWMSLVEAAVRSVIVSPFPDNGSYLARNRWISDNCRELWALYDGRGYGGTRHCVLYAEATRRMTVQLWDEWLEAQA